MNSSRDGHIRPTPIFLNILAKESVNILAKESVEDRQRHTVVFFSHLMDFSEEKSFQSEQMSKGFLNKDFLFLGDVWKVKIRKSQLDPLWNEASITKRPQTGSLRGLLEVCYSNSRILRYHIWSIFLLLDPQKMA